MKKEDRYREGINSKDYKDRHDNENFETEFSEILNSCNVTIKDAAKAMSEMTKLTQKPLNSSDAGKELRKIISEINEPPESLKQQVCGDHYKKLGEELGALVDEKQKAYGDSFGKSGEIMKILYPEGIKPEQYKDVLAITRIIDKLFRIANDKGYGGENPFKDIAGYGLLGSKGE